MPWILAEVAGSLPSRILLYVLLFPKLLVTSGCRRTSDKAKPEATMRASHASLVTSGQPSVGARGFATGGSPGRCTQGTADYLRSPVVRTGNPIQVLYALVLPRLRWLVLVPTPVKVLLRFLKDIIYSGFCE